MNNSNLPFRIWDTEQKIMTYFDFYDVSKVGFLYEPGYSFVWKYPAREPTKLSNENPITRGTGIKDINGKEIFEGDLVGLHPANLTAGFGLYEIVYRRAAFELKEIKENWALEKPISPYLHNYNICKVVGNIFENSELIKS